MEILNSSFARDLEFDGWPWKRIQLSQHTTELVGCVQVGGVLLGCVQFG